MPNATISTMVSDLATVVVDSTAVNNYQDEILFEWARATGVLFQTDASFTQAIAGQATYSLPTADGARTLLTLHYDGRELAQARKDEGWALDPAWRTSPKARPISFVMDPENRTDYTLIPPPIVSGIAPVGVPVDDEGFEPLNLVVLYSKTDLTMTLGPYQDVFLPLAVETMARELGRDSDHQDKVAAAIAHKLAEFLKHMAFPEIVVPGAKTGSN